MAYANVSLKQRAAGETMRRDAWWTQPLFVFLGLSTFILYSTWAAFQGAHYWARPKRRRLSFAFLFARDFWELATRDSWCETWLVAVVAILLAGPSGSLGAGRFSPDVLLLPRRLLQGVLG